MAEHRDRRRRSTVRLRALLALGAVAALGVGGTWAQWTDSATVEGITITTGGLDLQIDGEDSVDDVDDGVGLSVSGMVPGSTTAAVLTVTNSGTVALGYTAAAAASTGSELAGVLTVDVSAGGTVSGSGTSATCTGGTAVDTGTLTTSIVSAARTLAAGASEELCVQVTLPTDAASSLQSASTTVTLTFTASQE
ncbi:MAG: SipW-dependent-type signal peptide-containing protein [Nocardioides sp.]|uniref:SipW-dependent-type signal peptide-containing protein n=1 Tax=Nocardioides sp. TaxID=35761 RepID=UPI0039E6DC17